MAKGQYVELSLEKNDRVFVILAEFVNNIHPAYGGNAGPQHNQIAQPDRALDNTTIWQADFNKAHYEDMYFSKMVDYYKEQSSGRYTINGDVVEWVRVPFNEARYGSNFCGSKVCSTTWYLIRDAVNQWVANQKAAGMTNQQIHDYLATLIDWVIVFALSLTISPVLELVKWMTRKGWFGAME